jgi:hypothetical protein
VKPRSPTAISLLVLALGAGCPGSLEDPSRFQMQMMTGGCAAQIDVETQIFPMKCNTTACHEGPSSSSGLDLTTPGQKKRLVGLKSLSCPSRTIVTPSSPSMSVILDRVSDMPVCGVRMPLARDPLKTEEIDCLKAWVEDAARSSTTAMGM